MAVALLSLALGGVGSVPVTANSDLVPVPADEPIGFEVNLTPLPDFTEVWHGQTLYWEKAFFTDSAVPGSSGIPFGLALPTGYNAGNGQHYPLVIYLHGADARGNNDNKNLLRETARFFAHQARTEPCFNAFVLSPQVPPLQRFVNVEFDNGPYQQSAATHSTSMQLTENLLDYLTDPSNAGALASVLGIVATEVDTNRLYVVGDSMGAYGTWDILGRGAIPFAAAIAASGSGPANRLAQIQATPLWVIHGEVDTIVPNFLPHLGDPDGAGSLGMLALIDPTFVNSTSTLLIQLDDYASSADDPNPESTLVYSQFPGQFDHASVATAWTASMTSDFSTWLFGHSVVDPPLILTQPATTVDAFAGDAFTLSVEASGTNPLQYQWTFNGSNIAGATEAVYLQTDAQLPDSGIYAVTISNPVGTTTSSNSLVTVTAPNLWQILESTGELSTFKAAVETAGLVETLQGPEALTLFAPDNTAFEALPSGVWEALLENPELLLGALTYHALPGTQTAAVLISGDYETLNGASVTVTVTNVLLVNDAEVIVADRLATNGVVHRINTVLLPAPPQILTQPETTVDAFAGAVLTLSVEASGANPLQYQWTCNGSNIAGATEAVYLQTDAQLPDSGIYSVTIINPGGTTTSSNSLVTITVPNLWQILETTGELSTFKAAVETAGLVETLQGPEALTLFAPDNTAFEALPSGVWEALLENPELLLGALTYHALPGTQTTANLVSGDYETLNGASVTVTVTNVLLINDAEVIVADRLATNGVVHRINTVLLPAPPQILTQPETTVDAFAGAVLTLSVEASGANPLQYQWTCNGSNIAGATEAVYLQTDAQVSDAGIYSVTIINPGGSTTSSNSLVTITVPNLWQIVESTGELSTFKAAVETAGLVETLQGPEALTLFVPDNAAFEALPEGVWEDWLENPELLLGTLTYHALPGTQTTANLVSGDYETLNGASVTVTVTDVLLVNDAEVIRENWLAINGVVHIIDTVLFPPDPPVIGPPAIVDGNFTITWTGGGEVQTASDIAGPWEPTGNNSGLFVEPLGSGNRFFRIIVDP